MTEFKKGMVLEAKHLRRFGSATHAVIDEMKEDRVHLRSVRISADGRPEFFHGAQTRWIDKTSIPKRYHTTDMTMKL